MVVVAFPAFKLGALLLNQVSKPLANVVKARAKSSPFFRTWICMPPAQFYHWAEVRMRMLTMNLGRTVNVPKLNEAMAIELGAELLGEGIIYVTAAGILIFEYVRTSRKEAAKEKAAKAELAIIQSELKDLYYSKARLEAQLSHLTRVLNVKLPDLNIAATSIDEGSIPEHHRINVVDVDEGWVKKLMGLFRSAIDTIVPPVDGGE